MSWLKIKDITATAHNNDNKILGVSTGNSAVVVKAEDIVAGAIATSATVQTSFNTQVGSAIENDNSVKNKFNTQVSNAITNDNSVKNSLTTQITNVNNAGGTTVTYANPPTVGGQPLLVIPNSTNDGDHLIYNGLGTTDVSAKKIIVKASAAERTRLVNFGQSSSQLRTAETFQRILNEFYRFSHGQWPTADLGTGPGQKEFNGTGPGTTPLSLPLHVEGPNTGGNHVGRNFIYTWEPPSTLGTRQQPNEESAWNIDPNTNALTQTINSFHNIGFASPELYDSYDTVIRFTSSGGDNDTIGFVIALNRGAPDDPDANTPLDTLLSVQRDLNTNRGLQLRVSNGLNSTLWSDTNTTKFTFGGSGNAFNWPNYDGCPIKISRRPNRITVWGIEDSNVTPSWDDPAWGAPVFDYVLTDVAELNEFTTPGSWGLCATSQGGCTWADLMFNGVNEGGLSLSPMPDPSINNRIFDVEAGTSYIWQNGGWVEDPGVNVHNFVDSGQLLLDTASKSLYVKDNGELQLLQSERKQAVELTNNSGITENDLGKLIIALPGCSRITFDGNYGIGWHCTILNMTNGTLTLDTAGENGSGGTTPSGSRFGDALLTANNTSFTVDNAAEVRCYGNGFNNGANISPVVSAGNYGT